MESNIIFAFISNRLKSVERHLSGFEKDRGDEHLHHLRVDIKRTRAVFSFIENTCEIKFGLERLKLLFKKAGEIRELQISIALLSHLPIPPENLILHLKKKAKDLAEKFIKNIPRYLPVVKELRKGAFFSFQLPHKDITVAYLRSLRGKAVKCFNSKDRMKMHRFRKLIKKMMYVYAILPEETQQVAGLNIRLVNKLQKEAGSWHDTHAAVAFLAGKKFEEKAEYIAVLKQKEAVQFDSLFSHYPVLNI
jgi:CHAD domain-containing protein